MVRRYEGADVSLSGDMTICEGGQWVRYTDYAKLEAEVEELREHRKNGVGTSGKRPTYGQLEAKVERLVSRGIEDMHYTIANLEAEVERLKQAARARLEAGHHDLCEPNSCHCGHNELWDAVEGKDEV